MEFEVLQEALVEVMNVAPNEIHMDTTLAGDLGMDSLDAFQIILKIAGETFYRAGSEKDRKGGNCQAGSKAA